MPIMVEATPPLPGLSPVAGKPLIARFDGGRLSSNGGLLALREVERRLGRRALPEAQAIFAAFLARSSG